MVAPDVRKTMADKQRAAAIAKEESAGEAAPPPPKKDKKSATTQPTTRPVAKRPHGKGTVWVADGKYVRPIKVRTGASDGVDTEIFLKKEELKEGMALVVGEVRQQANDTNDANNPFAPPKIFGKKR